MNKNKIRKNNLKGMSFLEAIIGIFIFSLIMFTLTGIFTSSFGGYKKAQKMEKNIEDVNFAMNQIAKSLRTSKIISAAGSNLSQIVAYDFSQSNCNRFTFVGEKIQVASFPRDYKNATPDEIDCSSGGTFSDKPMTSQYVTGSFTASKSIDNTKSTPDTMGKVTIIMKVCSASGDCTGAKDDKVVLQTTVSLRDYDTVGL